MTTATRLKAMSDYAVKMIDLAAESSKATGRLATGQRGEATRWFRYQKGHRVTASPLHPVAHSLVSSFSRFTNQQ